MAAIKELAYAIYEASDLAEWEHFGVDMLGMQTGERTDKSLTLRTDNKAYRWGLQKGPEDDIVATGYEVASNANLDEIAARLRSLGFQVDEGGADLAAARRVDRILVTTDPLGYRIELVTGFADAPTPFHSKVMTGPFLTGAAGAGHQFIPSRGVPRADYMKFFGDGLGFKLSDYIVEEIAPGFVADAIFLHCNPRHHTLALGDLPYPKKQHHFMLQVTELFDLGFAWDRCLKGGQTFTMTLGGHPNDHMVSFYVDTPSGWTVEYGWGGVLIEDEDLWQKTKVTTYDKLDIWGHHPHKKELAWLQESAVKLG